MKAKEQAIEILNEIHQYIPLAQDDYGEAKLEYKIFNAKQCARIVVDRLYNEIDDNFDTLHSFDRKEYWKEVKKEIELL